ncbi:MAG: hypothetical protein K9M02_22345 [Thiohalocapsa sp.]|nr:hypothetical protein [Thiohalocapsa sp.]
MVQALMGTGAVSVREFARRLGRDVNRVHEDVTALEWSAAMSRTMNSETAT